MYFICLSAVIMLACLFLAVAIMIELIRGVDFHGIPFLIFGIAVGISGFSLIILRPFFRSNQKNDG